MPTSDSGSGEELKLKITPELDQAALKKAQDQLNTLKAPAVTGSKGGGTSTQAQTNSIKQQTAALKDLVAAEKLAIDQIDLRLRKTRTAANQEIAAIRERAAAGKITMEQMNQQILQQQSIIDTATVQADVAYKTVATSLENLANEYRNVAGAAQILTTADKKLYYAQGRMVHGMDSMSGSMQKIVSQTKNANLAFMNFGRVVQDAPFGLIGIANNIDPLLMSFRQLSTEIDVTTGKVRGTMGAFKALGSQLFGPAGLIFLLGSALPSALLVLQKSQQSAGKESNILAEAFKNVANEFTKLAAQAAGKKGLPVINEELAISEKALKKVEKEISSVKSAQQGLSIALSGSGAQLNDLTKEQSKSLSNQLRENEARLKALTQTKDFLANSAEQLRIEKERINANEFINEAREELGLAESLREKERLDNQQLTNEYLAKELKLRDQILGEIQEEKNRINKEIRDTREKFREATEKGLKSGLGSYIIALEQQLPRVEEIIRAKYEKANKAIKDDTKDLLKELERFQLEYTKYVQGELENRLLDARLNFEEIYNSEFATNEQRIEAEKVFLQNVRNIINDDRKKRQDEEEKERQERLKKDLEARREFVRRQQEIMQLSQDQIQGRYDLQLMAAQLNGDRLSEIELDRLIRLNNLEKTYAKLNLLNTKEYAAAKAAIEKDSERQVALFRIEQIELITQAIGASFEAIFGENKALASSIVIVDTIMGIQKALTANADNIIKGVATAAMLAAQGAIALRKINSTKKGQSQMDGSTSATPTTREVMIEGVGSRQGQYITPRGTVMSASAQPMIADNLQNINIDAKVDRRGLAIAVREGEREIRTSEFSYT
jgi:hypothetical protein